MSDDDDNFMCDSGEEFDFQYSGSDADGADEPDADLENQYYMAKQLRDESPSSALAAFEKIVAAEDPKAEWGFKALKQSIKLLTKKGDFKAVMDKYAVLLTYVKSAVSQNYFEKSISNILDRVSTPAYAGLMVDLYELTIEALKKAKNDRLWFKTQMKIGKMCLDAGDIPKLTRTLKELYKSCQNEDGSDDLKKGTQVLEVYSLEIQMHTLRKDRKQIKAVYDRALKVKSAIPHPLTMGVIRECGGKMYLGAEQWQLAYQDFFEAFKCYDESGSAKKLLCLKYLVLANMLMKSDVDPFEAQESKPYKNDPQILAMTSLVRAYQANDIRDFERILKVNRSNIMDDPFVSEYIQDLLKNIRTEVLVKLIRPYTRVRLDFISAELNVPVSEVESLLVTCILDGVVAGRIDQVSHCLMLDRQASTSAKFGAVSHWTKQVNSLTHTILQAVN